MNKRNILVLTSRFPFEGGEYFLETEVKYWREVDGVKVYILPFFQTEGIREYPKWVDLKNGVSKRNTRFDRVFFLIMASMTPIFWREILALTRDRNLKIANVVRALLTVSRVYQAKKTLEFLSREIGGIDLVYSYWNGTFAYAAALLRKKGLVRQLVTRTHGSDLYKYALKNEYMPIKAQLVNYFDVVAAVSAGGCDYYRKQYPILTSKVIVSRLGVEIDGRLASASESNQLSIVSVSNCLKIKRLEIIAAAVLIFAVRNPTIDVKWTHIGDGPTLESVEELWRNGAATVANATALFTGRLSNRAVINLLAEEPCDLVVNASASEGIPVSLMEAMSLGIPAVAPQIGGIPELVSPSCGYLLPPMPTAQDVANGFQWGFLSAKSPKLRKAAADCIVKEYSASRVYSDFYDLLLSRV